MRIATLYAASLMLINGIATQLLYVWSDLEWATQDAATGAFAFSAALFLAADKFQIP